MTENNAQILEFTRDYVTELYKTKVDPKFVFHNLHHTQQVVIAAEEVATHYSLNQDDHLVLILAAWFHDTGFRSGHPEEHEKESIRLATEFLQHHQVNAEVIHRVSS